MVISRLRVALGLAALLTLAVASGAGSTPQAKHARCASGAVPAVIGDKSVCLRRGQKCVKRLDRQYHRHGFHCHSGRLEGGSKPKPQAPPAGKIVATIPSLASGGIAVGAGSVWVANTATHTVTRIDPATNSVVTTIPVGTALDQPFHGPTRLAFGHGTMWVLDGTADCSCVHRIDPATNTIVATIKLGIPTFARIAPLDIAVQPDGVWIAVRLGTEDAPDGSVIRVDPTTNSVSAIIGAGSSPEFGGPTRIAAEQGSVWFGVPSQKAVVRVNPASNSVVATTPGMTCAEGDVATDELGVWVADCDAVRMIDRRTQPGRENGQDSGYERNGCSGPCRRDGLDLGAGRPAHPYQSCRRCDSRDTAVG